MEFAIKQEGKYFVIEFGNLRLKFKSADQFMQLIKMEQIQVTVNA
jgi:hypothetical protein